jgi:hypothetical protein
MDLFLPRTRRTFLADLGRGGVALAVVTIAGCAPSTGGGASASASTAGSSAPSDGPSSGPSAASAAPSAAAASVPPNDLGWERVNLGFVSA